MRKVRVLREMPFAKVGDTAIESRDGSFYIKGQKSVDCYTRFQVDYLIEDGWLSWVEEEKSLEEKFQDLYVAGGVRTLSNPDAKQLAQASKDHLRAHPSEIGCVSMEEVLEIVDDWWNNSYCPDCEQGYNNLRKAIKGINEPS